MATARTSIASWSAASKLSPPPAGPSLHSRSKKAQSGTLGVSTYALRHDEGKCRSAARNSLVVSTRYSSANSPDPAVAARQKPSTAGAGARL